MTDKELFILFWAVGVVIVLFIALLTRGTGKKNFYWAIVRIGIIIAWNILIRLPFGDRSGYVTCPFSYNNQTKECDGRTSKQENWDSRTMSTDAFWWFIIAFLPIILYWAYRYIKSQEKKK